MALTGSSNTALLDSIAFGTGLSLYRATIIPAIQQAETEVLLVTCFWAKSQTLNAFGDALRHLSREALRRGRQVRVRICFSSSSVWQKLFHTLSVSGQSYAASRWQSLGLPDPAELKGLDMRIKSIFCLPFSVMHPKFVVIDRKRVFLPSCNVSWEEWFEGCLDMRGPITESFVNFWLGFWSDEDDREDPAFQTVEPNGIANSPSTQNTSPLSSRSLNSVETSSIFLPSPHHRFLLPWLSSEVPPETPLNTYVLDLIHRAQKTIFMQTPNLTCRAVIRSLQEALRRGINVSITTSQSLMVLEQLVTAGTTTQRCVRGVVAHYQKHREEHEARSATDLEAGLTASTFGRLCVRYYEPHSMGDPVHSHLKLTIVDGSVAVFGSGNMDRASWFTSQELGLAIASKEAVAGVADTLALAMERRSSIVFDSEKSWVQDS